MDDGLLADRVLHPTLILDPPIILPQTHFPEPTVINRQKKVGPAVNVVRENEHKVVMDGIFLYKFNREPSITKNRLTIYC